MFSVVGERYDNNAMEDEEQKPTKIQLAPKL